MRICIALIAALCLVALTHAAERPVPSGKKIFIEKMDGDLDGYIRAEFTKQHIPLQIVLSSDQADLIMMGTSEKKDRKWHEGWLTAEQDHTAGNISVVDPKAKAVVWSGEAGDRSLMWGALARGGQRKVAARIVGKLKDAIQK